MAEEATKTPLDDSKDRLREAKDERKIAKDRLSKAKQDLVEVRREYPEKIATAKNALWHARETLRTIRKDRKQLARRRRKLHRQRHRNEAARAKLDARIEKKQHAAAKMEARIREDKERLERLPRKGRVRLMLCRLLKAKIAYLEWRLARTRQTTKRLKEGTGQLDESRKRIEDEQKDVENLLKDKEREEDAAIKDVEKKRRELDTLTDARKKEEEQAENNIRTARENVREKRRAVWGAASRVNRKVSQFLRKRVADKAVKIVKFGRWAGFAGVAGCFYAYAVSLGAIYRYFSFRSNGVNIFSYAEPIDFLAPGYSLAVLFMLMTGLVFLIPLVLYHLVKLIVILPLPLSAEILAAGLPRFAEWVPKTSLFVLSCIIWLLCSLLVAAGVGHRKDASPAPQSCVSIVTDPPFQYQPEYVRIGSTSKYLFLREEAGGCPVPSTAPNNDDRDLCEKIKGRLKTAWAGLLSIWDGDEGNLDPILVVPLSKITCISETTGNGEGLCRPAAVKSPPPAEDPVDQHIVGDMRCRAGTELITSDFVPFVYNKGDEIAECAGTQPRSKDEWEEEIRRFVGDRNNKERKWRVYGLASLDGDSAENDDLSRQRAETVRDMLCTASKIWSSIKECQEKVEIRYLGENNLVTAGPKSRSAVIAVCERVPEQNPGKTTTPARKPVPSSG